MSTIASGRLGGQGERIGHDEPALRVGVHHLDGRAAADVITSPSSRAVPDGMLSVHMR